MFNTFVRLVGVIVSCFLVTQMNTGLATAQTVNTSDISDWKAKDDPGSCDEIGWGVTATVDTSDNDVLEHHLACRGSMGYMALCGEISGDGMFLSPPTGTRWIGCMMVVGNAGDSAGNVSPFDFTLVDASGGRHDMDVMAFAGLGMGADMFATDSIRSGQNMKGLLAFSIPTSAKLPFLIEIDPMLDFSFSKGDPAVIVIDQLVDGAF